MALGDESGTLSVLAPGAVTPTHRRRALSLPLYRLIRGAAARRCCARSSTSSHGLEHLPASGPFILAANHHNYLDGVVLGVAVPRPIAFLVMPRVYRASPLHPLFHRRIGSIPVNLERPDPGAIKRVLRVLERGPAWSASSPRARSAERGGSSRGQPGVAMIALRVGRAGGARGDRGHLRGARGAALLHAAPPPALRALRRRRCTSAGPRHRRVTRAEREEVTRRIMAEIAALLAASASPERRRGRAGAS